ncbi:hypothetical protein [Natronobeatus ordinarius]|uniref:hypothetical protein n=1 Tax=Natronobeatus ordinarius TaxID=2963433 RepID=UPI0020CE218D|nr:hypothetical protein [Natronobeatus ordinarius]
MTNEPVRKKAAAQCKNCKNIFASEVWGDGSIRPIGVKRGCTCGNGEFRLLA